RLLEEPWLEIDGISGTSAGAMNAAVLVAGHAEGGAERARDALKAFWRRVARAASFSPLRRGPLDVMLGRWTLDSNPVYIPPGPGEVLAARHDPRRAESAPPIFGGERGFRPPRHGPDQAVRHGDQRPHRPAAHFSQQGRLAGRAAGVRVLAVDVSGGRGRRRDVLGWRLRGQPADHAARARMRLAGHDPDSDQPDRAAGYAPHRARDHQPDQRGVLQREPPQGAADDRPPSEGGGPRP